MSRRCFISSFTKYNTLFAILNISHDNLFHNLLEAELKRRERLSLRNWGLCIYWMWTRKNLDWVKVIYIQRYTRICRGFFYVHKLLTFEPKLISSNIKKFSHPEYVYYIKYFYSCSTIALSNNAIHFSLFNSVFIHEFAWVIPWLNFRNVHSIVSSVNWWQCTLSLNAILKNTPLNQFNLTYIWAIALYTLK